MSDVRIRIEGRIGRITLDRPDALNALNYEMCLAIEAALDGWASDESVACVLIDATGRAFCAGGDLQQMYRTARAGNFDYGRRFWRDEYRLNARIATYPKPFVALIQGFDMGGGVGISCHGSHRVVGETARVAMPECAVGLVPDVGGSLLLARAPGRLGEYLGMTGHRMDASDAILAGFADHHVPEDRWPDLTEALIETGDPSVVATMAEDPPDGVLKAERARIDRIFAAPDAAAILDALDGPDDWARTTTRRIAAGSPLSVCCTVEIVRAVRRRTAEGIAAALDMEYRFTSRSAEHGDFIEGIRAAIIDKDRQPRWRHDSVATVPPETVAAMLAPMLAPVAGGPATERE